MHERFHCRIRTLVDIEAICIERNTLWVGPCALDQRNPTLPGHLRQHGLRPHGGEQRSAHGCLDFLLDGPDRIAASIRDDLHPQRRMRRSPAALDAFEHGVKPDRGPLLRPEWFRRIRLIAARVSRDDPAIEIDEQSLGALRADIDADYVFPPLLSSRLTLTARASSAP